MRQEFPDSSDGSVGKKSKISLVYAIVIGVLLVIIAGGAYAYKLQYDAYQDEAALANAKIAKLEAQIKDLKSQNSETGSENKDYLTITEWGVKIPLTEPIYDAIYVIDGNTAWLSTKALAQKNGACDPYNTKDDGPGGVGIISKSSPSDIVFDQVVTERYPSGVQNGNFYYYFVPPQGICTLDKADLDLELSVVKALKTAGPQLELAK